MTQPIDQGAVMRSGALLVPDYALQLQQEQMLRLQQQQSMLAGQKHQFDVDKETAANTRRQQYGAAVAALGDNPTSDGLLNIMMTYPEYSEDLKRSYDAMEKGEQQSALKELVDVYSYASSGDYTSAAGLMQRQMDADKAAGMPIDPIDQQVYDGLTSGDPNKQANAVKLLEGHVSVLSPNYTSQYQAFNPESKVITAELGAQGGLIDPRTGKYTSVFVSGSPPPQEGGVPPAAAIKLAKQNPSYQASFDEKYGKGAYDKYVTGGQTPSASGNF